MTDRADYGRLNCVPLVMSPSFRRTVYPQYVLFFLLGAAFAAWASRIPAIRDALQLTPATLTFAFVARGIGTVAVFPLSAWLVNHFGPRRAALFAGFGMLGSIPLLAWAPDWYLLAMMLFVAGGTAGCYDVAINAMGSSSEQNSGISFMSRLHAWFGVGNFSGALLGGAAAGAGLSPMLHFSLSSGVLALVLAIVARYLPELHIPVQKRRFELPHGGLVVLGVVGFLGSSVESQVNSWVTLLFTDHLQASGLWAPAGYAAFACALLVMRLNGDRLKMRFGAWRVLPAGAFAAAAGILLASQTGWFWLAVAGFALAGSGVASTFPFLFSAAGKEGAHALTAVATMGYLGGIIAPPAVGFVVEHGGLRNAFVMLAGASFLMGIVSLRAKMLRPEPERTSGN